MLMHDEIVELINRGLVKNAAEMPGGCLDMVNTASLDIRLGSTILVEEYDIFSEPRIVTYRDRESPTFREVTIPPEGFVLSPGEFVLGHSKEYFVFPENLGALYRAKSSMGRSGFEHADAGWVDPGFFGMLTLEFCNLTRGHAIRLFENDRVGQLIFEVGSHPADESTSYRTLGNYCGFDSVARSGFKK